MSIGTFLTTGKCMRHSETIGGRESCVSDVIRWRPLQTYKYLFTEMAATVSLTVAATAAVKNMQFVLVHCLCCSRWMTKKKENWRNKKDGVFAHGLRGAGNSANFMIWWRKLKVEDPKGRGMAFANFFRMDAQQFQYILDAVSPLTSTKQRHSNARSNINYWAPCRLAVTSLFNDKYNIT